jgi:hypothetical protein
VRAEGVALDVGQLRADHQALIARESVGRTPDAAKVLASDDELLYRRPRIDDLDSAIVAIGERAGFLQCRLQRASSPESSVAIAYAREEAQLDRICDVRAIRERACAGCM